MGKSKSMAIVFVDDTWYNTTLRYLLDGVRSTSTDGVYTLTGPVKDTRDPHGLWLEGINTSKLKNGVDVPIALMIPWRFIRTVGLFDESDPAAVGFNATLLKDQPDE